MKVKGIIINVSVVLVSFLASCSLNKKEKKAAALKIKYEAFRDSVIRNSPDDNGDDQNIFDSPGYIPGVDSLETMLIKFDTLLRRDAALMEQLDTMKKRISNEPGFSEAEKAIIRENIQVVDTFLAAKKDTVEKISCHEKDCILFAEIDKSKQLMYLYLLGELKDSFKVSTGKGKYETPELNLRPQGPIVTKYTSKKFPGGNYKGLGNMPYAVFLKGGYAIHGTTTGSFVKLGTKASHGCIRLHPDNAKVFNALVKTVGLANTWVSIRDSVVTNALSLPPGDSN